MSLSVSLHHVNHTCKCLRDNLCTGGGLAGLVLAARLSEDPNVTVCVLEGGAANLDDPAIRTFKRTTSAPPILMSSHSAYRYLCCSIRQSDL